MSQIYVLPGADWVTIGTTSPGARLPTSLPIRLCSMPPPRPGSPRCICRSPGTGRSSAARRASRLLQCSSAAIASSNVGGTIFARDHGQRLRAGLPRDGQTHRRCALTDLVASHVQRYRLKSPRAHLRAFAGGNTTMLRLTPPKHITFYISVAVAVIAVIIHYAHVDLPHVHSGFLILLIGYLVLLAGNVLEGV
jgi:hypothetical protein